MEYKYVLVCCPLFNLNYDLQGNKFNGEEEIIKSQKYDEEKGIDGGLYGILWGKNSFYRHKNILNGNWAVVKTKKDERFVTLDKYTNEVKFDRGIILHIGSATTCKDFIMTIRNDDSHFFSEEIGILKEENILTV